MRDLFRRFHYEVYLVDEFRTSCRCSYCESELKKFRIVDNPRPYRIHQRQTILCHGVLRCPICGMKWNRDTNAAINITLIAYYAIRNEDRPEYLKRQKPSSSSGASSSSVAHPSSHHRIHQNRRQTNLRTASQKDMSRLRN